MHPMNFPTVIVGAGPAGLAAAIALGRRGVESLVVDRRLERSSMPRATTISTRSMELIRSWGLEDEVRAGGVEVEWLMWESPTLADAASGVPIEVGLPTRAQAALISPTAPACVPQDHLERVLLDHLRSLGSARVELGTALAGLENGPDDVRVTLRDAAGRSRVVTAGYVVAADGARSTARATLGIPMRGSQDLLAGVTALIRAPLWEVLGEHRYGIYATTQPGAGGRVPASGTGRPLGLRLHRRGSRRRPCGAQRARADRRDPPRGGSPRPARRDRADRLVHLGRPDRRSLPRGADLPGRRRRPPRDAPGRHRHEHRHPRRSRSGLEARLGRARLGRRGTARLLRGRAPPGRRAQRRPLR